MNRPVYYINDSVFPFPDGRVPGNILLVLWQQSRLVCVPPETHYGGSNHLCKGAFALRKQQYVET